MRSCVPPELWPGSQATPSERLVAALRPERSCEEDLLEAIAGLPDLDLLADMVGRATRTAFLEGAEVGRREVEQEHAEAGCSVHPGKRTN